MIPAQAVEACPRCGAEERHYNTGWSGVGGTYSCENQVIPAEAVEAAARGFFSKWDELPASSKEHFYPDVRAMLEAAAPHIRAQAIDKAADDAEGLGMDEIPLHALRHRANCYRTQP